MKSLNACLAFVAGLSLVSVAVPASAAPLKNIVLVHGAWVDASGWKAVYDILTKEGFKVTMVQEPETSFADDVAATKRVLDIQNGPTLLVGHSYGGSIITEAGMHPNVVGLVYVAAHAPESVKTSPRSARRRQASWARRMARSRKRADEFTYLDTADFRSCSRPICRVSTPSSWRGLRCWLRPRCSAHR